MLHVAPSETFDEADHAGLRDDSSEVATAQGVLPPAIDRHERDRDAVAAGEPRKIADRPIVATVVSKLVNPCLAAGGTGASMATSVGLPIGVSTAMSSTPPMSTRSIHFIARAKRSSGPSRSRAKLMVGSSGFLPRRADGERRCFCQDRSRG